MRRNYFRRTPRTQRRTTRRRNHNLFGRLKGRRNNALIIVVIIVAVYLLWRYPDALNRLMQQGPPAPSFPQTRP